ncbi:hypothetical protein SAMN05661091_4975 [Paenibacillus uliginis N3/975]|uniref:Uncharacterized protein n=1 Tax=Paenibacillus uliginis N3/975 TaxID=1313296 RepID=A0A1X7HQ27_9BACL|nr:hypothetical protein SAMN05661091_4975 [Paenibacillus uliginis N3/975]
MRLSLLIYRKSGTEIYATILVWIGVSLFTTQHCNNFNM